jgi:hypothetical protein
MTVSKMMSKFCGLRTGRRAQTLLNLTESGD